MMSSMWNDLKATYYVGKFLGFFPFDGQYKFISSLYSLIVWLSFCSVSVYISMITYSYTSQFSSKHKMLLHIITIRIFLKFIVAFVGAMVSAWNSKRFFELIEKFNRFDSLTLEMQWPSNSYTRVFFLLYVSLIEIYYLSCSFYNADTNIIILLMWTLVSASTMLMTIQYSLFVRALRNRYMMANQVFSNSINIDSSRTKYMYPKEIVNIFNELRYLTDDVKIFYSYHAILIIIDTILICVSCVTALILNYTNNINLTLFHSNLFSVYCIFKLLFLFLFIREIHITVQETKKTNLIAHEALSVSSHCLIAKELEVLIMTYWNNPIVFDVYDFFELDYKLIHMIISSIVTYVVILGQIQLAISEYEST